MAIDLVAHNPQLKKPVAQVLALAEELAPCDRRYLESCAQEKWDGAYSRTPGAIVDVLVHAGALDEKVLVEGEPYEGSLESIQLDESIPLDANVEVRIALTDEGRELFHAIDPHRTVAALLAEKPHYRDVFARVVGVCSRDGGASLPEVEAAIEKQGVVRSPSGDRVYPQYFIDALESAGAIEWGGSWRATSVGAAALQ